ncbi:retention module-containing protein [uncultured Campylobacter sp.]|uniref:retention module-containing protein n=1 Tax=uncultured Campylobacter sp. TaxID=218934 RepID=UPI00260EBFE2|nr:retention module-containing protein [uncultured Campylobacter sp.]
MAKEVGVVKSLNGKAVAVDQNGNERELKVGDIVYMGESIKTDGAADKITIVANNGKEITVLGSDALSLNPSTIGAEGLADISALQNAILNGGDLTKLEETAAGGNAAAGGGGDGVSLGAASFAEGGHYSNINETYRNLTDTNRAFESYDSSIGGYSNDGDDTIIPGAPTVKFVSDDPDDGILTRVEHANDNDLNTSKVLITVPNDGTVRVGDVLNITVTDPNGNEVKTNVVITPSILTGGYPLNAPIETGKISKVDATITNFQGNVSGKSEDSVTPTGFSAPVVKFTEDMNLNNNPDEDPDNDGLLTYTENNKDGNLNETPVLITVTDVIVGDILHVKLTKPDGTVENKNVPITQNIIDNGYKINDMPVAEDKLSKVEAYVTDSTNTMTSATASDETTPDVRPTLVFTEDGDNNGFLTDAENKGTDGNFRTSPVDITLPKDVVAGDKIVITYTDPLNYNNPSAPHEKTITVELTPEMVRDHKVTGVPLDIFPGVKTTASVHVVDKNDVVKSAESDTDNVHPIGSGLTITLSEQKTLHEISRQESVAKIDRNFNGVNEDLGDEKVNHTTAKITLPNRVDDGDKLTLSIKTPKLDPNDPEGKAFLKDSNGKTEFENTTRDFIIHVNDKGVITKVVEHTNSGDVEYAPLKEELNQWAINVEGFSVRHGEDTTITASITHINPNRNAHIAPVEASASLEYVKAPEVIFEEANGAKTMTREQAISVDGLNSTKVTIKLPKNAVSGDKLTVTINEPNETPRTKEYTVGRDANGKFFVKDSAGNEINTEADGRSFKISGIKTATGLETKVTAEIVDSDGSIQHAKGSSSVTMAGINDMAVRFVEDGDRNVSLARSESKDGDNDLLKTTIAVKVPNNVIADDVVNVTINNGTSTETKTYKVTGRDDHGKITLKNTSETLTVNDKNEIEIKGVLIEAGKTINVAAETTDASGGKKAEAKNHNTLEKLHNDMKITFEEDADNDGILYSAEANSDHSETTTTATIKLPSNFVVGDKLVVESYNKDAPNNKTPKEYTISKDAGGNLVAIGGGETLNIVNDPNGNKVVEYTLNLTEDHTTIINAKVTDNTGVDKVGTKSDIMLDAQGAGAGTGFRLFINEDSDRNEILSRDEAMTDGQLNTTSATLQIPTTVNSGDVIKVKVNGGVEQEYTVVSNVGNRITLKFPDNHTDLLPADNKLTIPDVHIDKDHPAQVEATINGVTKTAKATLETIDTKDLKVEFIEDDASRDKTIDRDEAISVDGVKVTTISVQVPYNVITGDKVEVLITEPKTDGTTATRPVNYTVSKAPDGKISLIDDTDLTHTPHELKNNTIRIGGVAMLPGRETSVTAIISNGSSEPVPSPEAKIKLAPLSEAGLNLNIGADLNDNGTITRDESDKGLIQSGGSTSKVNVSIPGSVIEGDKINVEITNPGATTPFTKSYKVISKDVNGNIVLEDLVTHSQFSLDRDQPLQFDAKIEVGAETKAKVTLTDAFDNHVSKTDSASAEIDAIRGALLRDSGSQDKAQIKVYLNEDAKAGDKVEFKYTDPDDHTQTKTDTYELTDQDIGKGVFEYSLDINARSAYDLNVETTLITPNGLASKVYSNDLHLNVKNYTINYDENSTMKGGEGSADTLVVDNKVVDFSRVTGLDAKVESFENIQLKGNSEIKFDANAIFDITDNPNTVLKIKGDATNKVDIKGKWELEKDPSIHADAGFKGYSSKDQVDGHTIHIQIDDKVQTDL